MSRKDEAGSKEAEQEAPRFVGEGKANATVEDLTNGGILCVDGAFPYAQIGAWRAAAICYSRHRGAARHGHYAADGSGSVALPGFGLSVTDSRR